MEQKDKEMDMRKIGMVALEKKRETVWGLWNGQGFTRTYLLIFNLLNVAWFLYIEFRTEYLV